MVLQVQIHFFDQFRLMRTVWVKPENGWCIRLTCPIHRQFHPITHGRIFHLAHTPNITRFDVLLHQHLALIIHNPRHTIRWHLKGLIVRTVFFRLLRHQAHVRHRTHRCRIKCTIGFAEIDHFLINTRKRAFRNHRFGILELAIHTPHFTAVTDHRRHRRIHNHIIRRVQIGNAFVGIDHRNFRLTGVTGLNIRLNFRTLFRRQ